MVKSQMFIQEFATSSDHRLKLTMVPDLRMAMKV